MPMRDLAQPIQAGKPIGDASTLPGDRRIRSKRILGAPADRDHSRSGYIGEVGIGTRRQSARLSLVERITNCARDRIEFRRNCASSNTSFLPVESPRAGARPQGGEMGWPPEGPLEP